jgi:hypothetical protein
MGEQCYLFNEQNQNHLNHRQKKTSDRHNLRGRIVCQVHKICSLVQ